MGSLAAKSTIAGRSCLIILFMLFISAVNAGTTGKIAGRVTDSETGNALPGANIIVDGTLLGTSTDQDGSYFIINVPPGIYTLKATFIGYEGINTSEVRVMVDRTTEVDFVMTPSVIEGAEVTIIAERPMIDKDLTGSMQVVSSDELDQSWARSLPEIMELQSGVSDGHYRGGTHLENVYMLNDISLNSGLLSDNYTGINISTIQEVVVLTGGYNAEYGSAQSGIVNVITKGAPKGIHATVVMRMRPAGKYHWGRNIYSRENYDWQFYDREYWADEKIVDSVRVRPPRHTRGLNPDSLLAEWHNVITPDKAQGDYAERAEYETEATIYGSLSDRLGFLLSGRFKRGVNIFPQQFAYNPEHNIQLDLNYKISDRIKLSLSSLIGGYETSGASASNFNSLENSQEMQWMELPYIYDPYSDVKYAPISNPWGGWPELRKVNSHTLKLTHAFSKKSFYEVWANLLLDEMDRTDRWGYVSDDLWSSWHSDPMLQYFLVDIYDDEGNVISPKHYTDEFSVSILNLGASYTSQVNNNNLVKAGFEYKSYEDSNINHTI
jgi:outer membrane receptor protein involved in Fe transport